jgi:hypothetical protein
MKLYLLFPLIATFLKMTLWAERFTKNLIYLQLFSFCCYAVVGVNIVYYFTAQNVDNVK